MEDPRAMTDAEFSERLHKLEGRLAVLKRRQAKVKKLESFTRKKAAWLHDEMFRGGVFES